MSGRSATTGVAAYAPGDIVLVDWRGDALPKEPNKRRPAVVVEDDLFPPEWPNVVLVPLTDDENLIVADLAVRIEPNSENGGSKPCWAVATMVTTTSKQRVTATGSCIQKAQLEAIRRRIGILFGLR